MAEEACHGFGSTTQVGLTQTLGESRMAATKEHFSAAAQEVDAGSIDAGLWAMATARARGDVTVTEADRKGAGWGKSGSVRVDLGGRRYIKKKTKVKVVNRNN